VIGPYSVQTVITPGAPTIDIAFRSPPRPASRPAQQDVIASQIPPEARVRGELYTSFAREILAWSRSTRFDVAARRGLATLPRCCHKLFL
jgi:hypothetical protein